MADWEKIRRDFPIVKRYTYLDHAACSPMPKPVFKRMLKYYQEVVGTADFSWNRMIARREEIRRKMAKFINAEPEEITFTTNTSHGMNLAAELIADKGAVLTNTLEFPATTVPWVHRRAKMKFLKPEAGIISLDQIKRNLKSARTILTSYVQFQNGFRQDLDAIGRAKGNRFFAVNATQGFGYLPIDVKRARIDFLATNTYKWFMSGYGGGIFYINRKWTKKFKPKSAGWRSVPQPELFDNQHAPLKEEASRYEYGCPLFPNIFAMGASLDYFAGIGFKAITKKILWITDFLIERLKKEGFPILSPLAPEMRSGIVVFYVKNAEKLTNQLLRKGIYVSPRGGGIRVAPHFYNNELDILRFIKAMKEEMTK